MINKLVEKIKKTGAPIVVGLDPMAISRSIYRKKRLQSSERRWRVPRKRSGSSIRKSWTRHMT